MLGDETGGRAFVPTPYRSFPESLRGMTSCVNEFEDMPADAPKCLDSCAYGLDELGQGLIDCTATGFYLPDLGTPFSSPVQCASTEESIGREYLDNEIEEQSCFPGHARVELESGEKRRMDELSIGDSVLVGRDTYSTVYAFSHKSKDAKSDLVLLTTQAGRALQVSSGHYLYVSGDLRPASQVRVGDTLITNDGSNTAVIYVGRISNDAAGMFNPHTLHGDIVVEGILASTYTTAVPPVIAHAFLLPLRIFHTLFGLTWRGLESDGNVLRTMAAYAYSRKNLPSSLQEPLLARFVGCRNFPPTY